MPISRDKNSPGDMLTILVIAFSSHVRNIVANLFLDNFFRVCVFFPLLPFLSSALGLPSTAKRNSLAFNRPSTER